MSAGPSGHGSERSEESEGRGSSAANHAGVDERGAAKGKRRKAFNSISMKLLGFDTSSDYLVLGISDGERLLYRESILLGRRHSTEIFSFLEEALKHSKLTLQELDGFVVGQGPGSFTGLRIGISVAKTLAYSLKKPLVAIPTMDVLAEPFRSESVPICPILDAKRNQVYTCLYQGNGKTLKRTTGYQLTPVEPFVKTLKGKVLFLGEGLRLYQEEIQELKKDEALFAPEKFWIPSPEHLLSLGRVRFEQKQFDDPFHLVPLYVYPRDCMIKKKQP